MAEIARKTQVITGIAPDRIPVADLLEAGQPAILKGLARHWPLVRAGLESPEHAIAYLKQFSGPTPITVFSGPPAIAGRFHYNDDVTGFNFQAQRVPLGTTLDRLHGAARRPECAIVLRRLHRHRSLPAAVARGERPRASKVHRSSTTGRS